MKRFTPQEIARAITQLCNGQPAKLHMAIVAAIQMERDQQRWAAEAEAEMDDDADDGAPWISPCQLDGEDGYQVLFGTVIVDWAPYADSAYHIIGDLLRRHGSAEAVRAHVLSEIAALEEIIPPGAEVELDPEPVLRVRRRKVLAA